MNFVAPSDFPQELTACLACLAMAFLAGGKIAAQAGPPSLLYVMDTGTGWFDHSQILQFDPAQGKTLKTFSTGQDPDMALSPDGTRLYATTYTPSDTAAHENHLSVYDTVSGKLLERISNPDAMQHTMPAYNTALAVSTSGRWLYIAKFHYNPDKSYYWYLTAFDTSDNHFLPVQVKFPCLQTTMVPMAEDLRVVLVCANSPDVFDINLSNSTAPMKRVPVRQTIVTGPVSGESSDMAAALVPPQPKESWGAVFLHPGDNNLVLASDSHGSIFSFDHIVGTSTKVGHQPLLKTGGISRGLVSQNENAVYFQIKSSQRSDHALSYSNQIIAADPTTFAVKGVLKTSQPFFTMALSKDGHTIFTVDPDTGTIGVVDASTLIQVNTITAAGKRPIYVIAAPCCKSQRGIQVPIR